MTSQFLATSKNGIDVVYDPVASHAATHFRDARQLRALVAEVVTQTVLTGDIVEFDVDMGRTVGNTDGVRNKPGDVIVYAKRINRDIYTPFNKSQSPQPCTMVSVSFYKLETGEYALHTAWIGSFDSPPIPGDSNETPESKIFWDAHSLVWGSQQIQPGSETTTCPW